MVWTFLGGAFGCGCTDSGENVGGHNCAGVWSERCGSKSEYWKAAPSPLRASFLLDIGRCSLWSEERLAVHVKGRHRYLCCKKVTGICVVKRSQVSVL